MKATVSLLSLSIFLLMLFQGCRKDDLAPATAGTDVVTERAAPIPFRASFQTLPTIIAFNGPVMTLDIPSTGNGTHIGNSTLASISQVFFNTFPVEQTGDMEITAADGSTLVGYYGGISAPGQTPGAVDYSGTFTITGGTGRFVGYTGSGTYSGSAVMPGQSIGTVGAGTLVFDGTMQRP